MVAIRYIFKASTVWQTEFVTFAPIAATFLGSPYVPMERGHVAVDVPPPPVGLNLYVINAITPDITLRQIPTGAMPYVGCMVLGIVLLCIFPEIATWLPRPMMGRG